MTEVKEYGILPPVRRGHRDLRPKSANIIFRRGTVEGSLKKKNIERPTTL